MEIRKLSWLGVIVGLSLFMVSCERGDELAETGERVAVRIHLQGIQNRQTEEFTRAKGLGEGKEIAQVSRVLDDGMLLEMSLEPDESSELRAQDLEVNKTFRVIALKSAGKTYVSHADFVVNSSGTAYTSTDLHVLLNTAHDFVCISYNNTDPIPALTCTVGQVLDDLDLPSDGSDLLYDRVENQTFTGSGDAELGFSLVHQLSKVSVVIDCTYNSWAIAMPPADRIRVAPCYTATLNYATGVITEDEEVTDQCLTTWTAGANNYTQTSGGRAMFTNGEAVSVVIPANALTISGRSLPSVGVAITFPIVTDLVSGGSYVLRVKFRSAMFANSNIYWVATDASSGRLMFDPYVSPGSSEYTSKKTQQQKQGVGFKWGSLVGVSMPGFVAVKEIAWNDTASIYVPTSPTVWTRTTVTAAVAGSKWSGTGYAGIPYVQDNGGPVFDRENNYLTTLGAADNALYKGDICKYLDNSYRMPRSNEFGPDNGAWKDWGTIPYYTSSASNELASQIDGQTLLPLLRGASMKVSDMYFPGSGLRILNGNIKWVGTMLQYWSSSAFSATEGQCLSAHFQNCVPGIQHDRKESMAVRCVLAD
jgi:hypothetical protein